MFEDVTITDFNTLGDHFGYPSFANATYDYVVVGGGTVGLTVAARLAEAGEMDNGNLSTMPGTAAYFVGTDPGERNPLIDWDYRTERLGGRRILYNSGKTFSGGSARNYMIYDRGTTGSYAKWADDVGDKSYELPNFLPYFKTSVRFDGANNDLRASNSSINASASTFGTADPGSWAKLALAELRLHELQEFVSGNLLGYQYASQTIDGASQTRSSAETANLRSAIRDNSQLQLYKATLAKRILFDDNKAARGVLVDRVEVIISAGAHRSPQLLMVSGVGPRELLRALEADQPFFGPSYPVSLRTHSALSNPAFMAEQFINYRESRTGYLTNPGSDFLAFEHAFYGMGRDTLVDHAFTPIDGRHYVSVLPTIVATFSRGNVSINSTDTAVNPIIHPNLLSDPRDREIAVAAFKRARQIANTAALAPVRDGDEVYPGPAVQTDSEILENIMVSTAPIWHAAGTCKMGRATDSMAVVDAQARVYGTTGLRVVDASVFPLLVPYALAEKIAAATLRG
ncbi:hypothetical protein BKA67DRAFT_596203 [Truncatella angustata]|uniref:Glucose-methanol-choline oxidoreductase N-terminal domain-containing protein n=1 Tax=Truncatella angustata TaxID=152316 RepID=A0A9P8RF57_9PEZI|nr:uncharacterized protein BKA67DRAFT_596203 [Truncatella angustata]KAH6643472.1 hypothetical protein BKA67DRAFT_596203 [Truncatella angustata]